MANYSNLREDINSKVYENTSQAITGVALNDVLNAIVSSLGNGYQFLGVVTSEADLGEIDEKVFCIAQEGGTYTHFDNIFFIISPFRLRNLT